MRSPGGLKALCALSGDQRCPHSESEKEPHGRLVDKGDISKHNIFGDSWLRHSIVQTLYSVVIYHRCWK